MAKLLEIKTQWIKSNMALVNLSLEMEGNILEHGRMENVVDKDNSLFLTVFFIKEIGKTE